MAERRVRSPWGGPRPELIVEITPPPYCPGCGAKLNGAASIERDGAHPEPGAVTICWYCSAVLEFHGKPLQLRRLEGDDLILALADPWVKKMRLAVILKNASRDG